MKIVALLVQPSGVELQSQDLAEMAARLPGLVPLAAAAPLAVDGQGRWSFGGGGDAKSLRELEREFLERVLAANQGNKSAAAKSLKMHRRTLQRKLARSLPAARS